MHPHTRSDVLPCLQEFLQGRNEASHVFEVWLDSSAWTARTARACVEPVSVGPKRKSVSRSSNHARIISVRMRQIQVSRFHAALYLRRVQRHDAQTVNLCR
jgi:hypothetical protein